MLAQGIAQWSAPHSPWTLNCDTSRQETWALLPAASFPKKPGLGSLPALQSLTCLGLRGQ